MSKHGQPKSGKILSESKSSLRYALRQTQIIMQIWSDNRPSIDHVLFCQLFATEKSLIYNLYIVIIKLKYLL